MYNGIGGMPAAPMQLLMGLFGGRPVEGAPGAKDFGSLLTLMGGAEGVSFGEGDGLPVSELPFGPKTNATEVKLTTLYLPPEMAQSLGLDAQQITDKTGQGVTADGPQSMVPVKAELLTTNNGKEQALFLKILPEDNSLEMASGLAEGEGNKGEMVLPMRLRTVEQREGRIIADAELQTATGKSVSLRLSLELDGSRNRIQTGIQNGNLIQARGGETAASLSPGTPIPGSENGSTYESEWPQVNSGLSRSAMTSSRSETSLSRLLHNLDVKSVVIEQVKGEIELSPRDILPRMAPMPRESVTPRITTNGTTVDSDSVAVSEAKNPLLFTIGNGNSRFSGFDSDQKDSGRSMSDGNSTASQTTVPTSNAGSESHPGATTTIPVSEIGNIVTPSNANSDITPLRFYNIDQKLDQLKQNPGQKITIQLVPAQLGKMELSISSYRGVVTVNLTVDSVQAKQAVERNLPRLESQLASNGIRVDNIQLQVNQPSKGLSYSAFQQQYDHGQGGFNGQRGQGFNRSAHDRQKMQQFNLSKTGFQQTLVNCLA